MVTKRQKQAAGLAAAALLLIGSSYAWQSNDKHRTNEMKDTLGVNDVTLVEDFKPITRWKAGDAVMQGIAVMNRLQDVTGNKAYVRIQIKEFLELTDKTENYSAKRYAIDTAGQFYKFDTLAEATAKAAEIGLPNAVPDLKAKTVFEGDGKYFIPTDAGGYNGQYGDFLLESLGNPDDPQQSIIDSTLTNQSAAAGSQHQTTPNDEDSYTVQKFDGTGADLRTYSGANRVNTFPTVATANNIADLKSYITWQFGNDVTTLADFDDTSETGQWVIDPSDGYVYWSQPLSPTETTPEFLTSVTLAKNFENASIYYAIHTNLEAVDFNDIDTMAPPTKIKTAWKNQKFTVTFNPNGGSAVDSVSVSRDSLITKPANPTMAGYDFVGWYAKADLTGNAWDFDTDKMPANDLTLYAKWEASIPALDVANTAPGSEFEFANTQWRILKTDMDDDASNGNQALVIRIDTLTNAEAGKGGTGTDEAEVNFRDGNYYFSADGSNGYEAGAGNPDYLKGAIDNYYTNYIANNADYVKYVQAVTLNNPSYDEFKSGQPFSASAYDGWWNWNDYYKDTRFKTTLGGAKQAFALSFGDIHTIAGVGANDTDTAMLDFNSATSTSNYCWLRSAGSSCDTLSFLESSGFSLGYRIYYTGQVRPALSIQIK